MVLPFRAVLLFTAELQLAAELPLAAELLVAEEPRRGVARARKSRMVVVGTGDDW